MADYTEDSFDPDDDLIIRKFNPTMVVTSSIYRKGRILYWQSKAVVARYVGACLLDLLHDCEIHWK